MGRGKKRGDVFYFPPNLVPRVLCYPPLWTERGTDRREPFTAFSPSSDFKSLMTEGQHRRLMISKNLVKKE